MNSYYRCMRRSQNRFSPSRLRQRHGVVLICSLVCLSVATALVVSMVQQSLIARRQGRMQWQMRQTEYLLDAGIRRAIVHLNAGGDYAGETWHPTAALPGFQSVVVEITATPRDGEPSQQEVTVLAKLDQSESLAFRTQRSHTFRYPITSQTEPSQPE